MINEEFKFSQRFELIMSNLKIIKEINEVSEDETEILRFRKYIADNLKDKVPDIQSWKLDVKGYDINIYPSDMWKVHNEYITIRIHFSKALNDESWVGLYVPKKWSCRDLFYEKLTTSLSKGFMDEWDDPDEESPIWSYVEYEKYANGESFDYLGYINNITEIIKKLVDIKDTINDKLKDTINCESNV